MTKIGHWSDLFNTAYCVRISEDKYLEILIKIMYFLLIFFNYLEIFNFQFFLQNHLKYQKVYILRYLIDIL